MYVTTELRGLSTGGLDKAREIIDSIEEDPTADKPLVGVTKELDVPAKRELATGIKFYNKDKTAMNDTIVVIDKCKRTSDGTMIADDGSRTMYPVTVVSDTVSIEQSTFASIPFTVKNDADRLSGGEKYICKLQLIEDDGTGDVRYTHSFFLSVRS